MKTIDILRKIVKDFAAQCLFFNAPQTPTPEGMDTLIEVYDTPLVETQTEFGKDRLLVDIQTANVIVTVYDALKPETQNKADKLMTTKKGFVRMTNIAWSAVS